MKMTSKTLAKNRKESNRVCGEREIYLLCTKKKQVKRMEAWLDLSTERVLRGKKSYFDQLLPVARDASNRWVRI